MKRARFLAMTALAPIASTMLVLTGALASFAAGSGNIDHVESGEGTVQVLFSVDGLPETVQPELTSVLVTIDGESVDATATQASGSSDQVDRVAVLALDVSNSMRGRAFAEAKQAALTFVDQAPADVKIGLVTFAGDVETVQQPTTERELLASAIDALRLSQKTRLYQGIFAALSAAGADGQRRVLVLSDGRDTTGSALSEVTDAVTSSGAQVDVVSLGQSIDDQSPLSLVAQAGQGALVSADDPTALTELFADEAQNLARQILITFPVPPESAGSDVDLAVSLAAEGSTYGDQAFVSLGEAVQEPEQDTAHTTPLAIDKPRFVITRPMLIGGVSALGAALLIAVASLLGVFRGEAKVSLDDRLAGYGGHGVAPPPAAAPVNVKESALGFAQKAIGRGSFEARLSRKLDAAGMSLKPAEWVLLHAGLAVVAAVTGFLLSSGGAMLTLLMLGLGAFAPWIHLGMKEKRRVKAFNTQLSDTLQLLSGGLKAGLSLAQSVDTIVREGTEPMAGEFRRALIEARLGVDIEDALDGVGDRMGSADFQWVVMAIRIQRQVGGNLAELLITVASTLREREYLRRQVLTLSAEGRLSAWILGGLPPAFMVFLVLTQGDYVSPMFHTTIGWVMLGFAAMLLAVGSFWMSKCVKVEV